MTASHKRYPDIVEGGRDRGVWLVYRDAYGSHAWKSSEHGRDAKVYELTRDGRRQLTRELESWNRLSSAVGLLLERA